MTIAKFTVRWDGWTGAPGYTNFYALGNLDETQTDAAAAGIKTFLEAIKGYIAAVCTLTFIPTVQIIAEGDGSLAEQRNIATVPANVVGGSSGNFAAAGGACITWRTNTSTGRRLLQGRTFIVPIGGLAMQSDGTLATTAVNGLVNAGNAYVARVSMGTPGRPVVWHRPKGGASGLSAQITNCTVADKVAVLRSRRD
jgi:hypothetical protein